MDTVQGGSRRAQGGKHDSEGPWRGQNQRPVRQLTWPRPRPRGHRGRGLPLLQGLSVWASWGSLVRAVATDLLPTKQGWHPPAPLFCPHPTWLCPSPFPTRGLPGFISEELRAEAGEKPAPLLCERTQAQAPCLPSAGTRGEPPPRCNMET